MIQIRRAERKDADAIADLHTAGWRDTYGSVMSPDFLKNQAPEERRSYWGSALRQKKDSETVYVVDNGNGVAGFICVKLRNDPRWGAYIDSLHIGSTLRGRGAGNALLRHAAQWINDNDADSPVYLWVFEDNHRATAFYQKLGGRVVERSESDLPASEKAPVLRISWKNAGEIMAHGS